MRSLQAILGAAVAAVLSAGPVHASPIIEFSTGAAGEGGELSWDGTNLTGSVQIGAVTISGAPTNNGVFEVTDGMLYLNTGSTGVTVADYWTAPGSNIVVVGCVPGLGIQNDYCGLFSELARGTLQGWNQALASQGLRDAFGADFLSGHLWFAIGLTGELGEPAWSFSGESIAASPLRPDGTPETVSFTSIRNTNVVPEPGSMILVGTGLLAAFQARRRRRS